MAEKVLVVDLEKTVRHQQLLDGLPQTRGMRSGRVYLKEGESCSRHSTGANEEMLVFLSGQALALIGENDSSQFQLREGKVLYIPPHTVHSIKNTGTKPLIYIYCLAPVNGPTGQQESCSC